MESKNIIHMWLYVSNIISKFEQSSHLLYEWI